uniref:restriction endonuclease subunit S n=1 Tax=uncultured Tenacibaculum sp. TaxID=174713 RepID=UPI0026338A55|nr:restriction endonuclease subunit S [uncultured Tenacibaculum sp.]
MKATDAYRRINNSPIRGIVLYYTEQVLQSQKVPLETVISEIQTGKTPPKSNSKYYSSNDIDWFKPSDIGFEKYLNNAREKFAQIALDEKKATLYPKDTLLLIGIGGGVGRVSILKEAGSSNQQITGLTFNNDVSSEYAYYYYLVREDYIKSQAKSMSFPILNQTKIKGLKISYPSIEEQNEFVRFVDYCWSSYLKDEIPNVSDFNVDDKLKTYTLTQFKAIELDSKIKANIAYQKQLLVDLKQAILQEAIQGKLTQEWREQSRKLSGPNTETASELLERIKAEKEQLIKDKKIKKEKPLPPIAKDEIPFEIPNNWTWCRLIDIGVPIIGLTYKPTDISENGTGVLRANNVDEGKLIMNNLVKVSCEIPSKKMATKGDILICVRSGSKRLIGKAAIVDKDGFSFGAFMSLIKSRLNPYLFHFLQSNSFKNQIDDEKSTGINQLTQGILKSIIIPIPPKEEQEAIAEKVKTLMQKCNALEQEITQSEQHANMLMQAVLKEAFESKTEKVLV